MHISLLTDLWLTMYYNVKQMNTKWIILTAHLFVQSKSFSTNLTLCENLRPFRTMLIFLRTTLNLNSIGEAQDNFVENIIMEFKIIVKNYLDCYVSCMELNKEHETLEGCIP